MKPPDHPITIRPYEASDAVSELTALVRQAYMRLADLGLRYTATWQDDAITRERLTRGKAYIALKNARIVGTITFESQHTASGCEWYDRPEVASFHQFAVHPDCQGLGVGTRLLATAEDAARRLGAKELALDTAEWAYHLIDMYLGKGFRLVSETQWQSTNYRSVIMSKDLTWREAFAVPKIAGFLRDQPSPEIGQRIASLEGSLLTANKAGKDEAYKLAGELGDLYRTMGETGKALILLEQAATGCVRHRDLRTLFVNRLRTAIAYQYSNKHELADFIFRQLLRDADVCPDVLDFVHQHYGKCLAELGLRTEALVHLNIAKDLRLRRPNADALLRSTDTALAALSQSRSLAPTE